MINDLKNAIDVFLNSSRRDRGSNAEAQHGVDGLDELREFVTRDHAVLVDVIQGEDPFDLLVTTSVS